MNECYLVARQLVQEATNETPPDKPAGLRKE